MTCPRHDDRRRDVRVYRTRGYYDPNVNGVGQFVNLATGYRAPSNYELYDGFSGNAALTPETSRSADLGIEKRYGETGFVRATAFWTEAEDRPISAAGPARARAWRLPNLPSSSSARA